MQRTYLVKQPKKVSVEWKIKVMEQGSKVINEPLLWVYAPC